MKLNESLEYRQRVCVFCGSNYVAFHRRTLAALCSMCRTPKMNKENQRLVRELKRAQKAKATATLTLKEWISILEYFKWKCAYCNDEYQVMEHIISVKAGGGTTALNCVPACCSCNRRKDNATGYPLTEREIMLVQKQLVDLFAR